jgi:hypothetical protein
VTVRACHLVLAHRDPGQVERLVAQIGALSPEGAVAVHWDGPGMPAFDGAHTVPHQSRGPWGSIGFARTILGSLAQVQDTLDPDWTWVLSGQDVPARPLDQVEAEVAAGGADAYLGALHELHPPPPGELGDEWQRRVFFAHRPLRAPLVRPVATAARRTAGRAYVRPMPTGGHLLGLRVSHDPFAAASLRCWIGSDWMTLSRRAVRALRDGAAAHPALLRHYEGAISPSESLPQTLLMNAPGLTIERDNRRWIRFDPGSPRPRPITVADVPAILASGAHYARKADPERHAGALDTLETALTRPR